VNGGTVSGVGRGDPTHAEWDQHKPLPPGGGLPRGSGAAPVNVSRVAHNPSLTSNRGLVSRAVGSGQSRCEAVHGDQVVK
jgi:hypothetical protein